MISGFGSAERWLERHEKIFLLVLFLVALSTRAVFFFSIRGNPFEDNLFLDAAFYDRWAVRIAGGDLLGEGPFFMGPFYPYFLALVYFIFDHGYAAVRLIQHAFGILTCLLVYFITRPLAGRLTACIASGVCAVYGVLLYYESQILICSLQAFLLTFFVFLFLKAARGESKRWWLAAGLCLGVSTLARGNVLLLAPLAAACPFFLLSSRRKAAVASLCFILTLIVMILPVTLRNTLIGGDRVFLTANGGFNFYIGNNPQATGAWVELPGVDLEMGDLGRQVAEKETGRLLKSSEVSRFWKNKAMDFIREHPFREAGLLLKKTCLFWMGWEIPQMHNNYYFFRDHYAPFLRCPLVPTFFLLGPFAVLGMIVNIKKNGGLQLVSLLILVYMFSITIFFVTSRYRNPVIPLMAVMAASGFVHLMEKVRTKKILLSVLFIFLLSGLYYGLSRPILATGYSGAYTSLGVIHARDGRYEEAVRQFRKALAIRPDYERARTNLAFTLVQSGDYGEAEKECRALLEKDPAHAMAFNTLGLIRKQRGDPEGAIRYFRQALSSNARLWQAHFNLGLIYRERGEIDPAVKHFEEVMEIDPENVKALNNAASLYAMSGRYDDAGAAWERCIRLSPGSATYRENLERLKKLRQR